MQTHGYAAHSADTPLAPFTFDRREPGPTDVAIDILFCGVCHSDLHTARGEWGGTLYPCVPGHEIVGRVAAVGSEVSRFAVGQTVGVGCMVDSCGHCPSCDDGEEQYCTGGGFVGTYNGKDKHLGGHTFGGYSAHIVVDQGFILRVDHDEKDHAAVAPLLCAGITTFNSLAHSGAKPGERVAVLGLGGLGHLGVQYAAKMGYEVIAIARGSDKAPFTRQLGAKYYIDASHENVAEALNRLGGAKVVLSTVTDSDAMSATIDGLSKNGTLLVVGASGEPIKVSPFQLIMGRKTIKGWPSGTAADSEATMNFSALTGVRPLIERYPLERAAEAYDRMISGKARFRVVLETGA